jgi:hypothetical protein
MKSAEGVWKLERQRLVPQRLRPRRQQRQHAHPSHHKTHYQQGILGVTPDGKAPSQPHHFFRRK